MSCKVSIIIPIYNVEDFVFDCLQSVARQTYSGPIECICVDDCTPDKSAVIAEDFIGLYGGTIKFSLLHHDVNRGLSAARNTGMDAATGDYIYFLDSDDELTADCIERLAKPLEEADYSFVLGDVLKRESGAEILVKQHFVDGEVVVKEKILKSFTVGGWFVIAQNKLLNLSWLRRNNIRFKEGLIHEDQLWSFEIASLAGAMYVVKHPTYIYKIRANSISTAKGKGFRIREAFVKIVDCMRDFIIEHNLTNNFYVYYHYQAFSRLTILKLYDNGEYERVKVFYGDWRNSGLYSRKKILSFSIRNLRSFFRDFHYFLPSRFGVKYMVVTEKFRWLDMRFLNKNHK